VSQRNVEVLIGRLLTDEGFRQRFLADPRVVLRELVEQGTHLTFLEIDALTAIDLTLWRTVAEQIDPRLQKAQLSFSPLDRQR